jgi:hypothetical protein
MKDKNIIDELSEFNSTDSFNAEEYWKFDQDETLSEEELKLLSELDSQDPSDPLAVDFTDDDLIFNSKILNEMSRLRGHANNVECCSYTYLINVYEKDAVGSTFKYTRTYEFQQNYTTSLYSLFNNFGAEFILRSETNCFGSKGFYDIEDHNLEVRAVFVYDLIVPVGFDIDATHYFHNSQLTSFEPWTVNPETWSDVLLDGFIDTLPDQRHLKMTPTSPNELDTRSVVYIAELDKK